MLRNTLIVPESDSTLAAKLVRDAIDDLDVILMFVFGKNPNATQIVDWADQLCNKTRISDSYNLRRVVWIRDPTPASLRAVLNPLFEDKPIPQVAVLNFHDEVKGIIRKGGDIDPIKLELLFLEGHQS